MNKKVLLTFMITLVLASASSAQIPGDTLKRWKKDYREQFLADCIATSKANLGEDTSKSYCQCMALKLEEIYPDQKDVDKLTAADFEKPEMMKLVRSCLTLGKWSETEKANFLAGCVKNAASLGEEKANRYCNCMFEKISIKYPSAKEAETISAEDLKKPEWKKLIFACLE